MTEPNLLTQCRIEARRLFAPILNDPLAEKQPAVLAELEKHAGVELPPDPTTQPTTAPAPVPTAPPATTTP